MTGNKMVYLRG